MLYLGTSGFSYTDWVGTYYPPQFNKRDWLAYYAREFNSCEINSTYYALPSPYTLKAMADKTGENFLFSVKAYQTLSHQRQDNDQDFTSFRRALDLLITTGKMGCVLVQFPYSFRYNQDNRSYLESLKDKLADLPLVVEFRNIQWLRQDVFHLLRQLQIGFCCVDEPPLPNLIPPVAEVTSNIAYVRLHGRNVAKWWQHEQAYERYDYTYSTEELQEWVPRIHKLNGLAEKTFIFANNHWRAQAVGTIRQLRKMLD